ncbi:MAG: two-component system response regulator NarL [Gammaproteobacteria bacterium]
MNDTETQTILVVDDHPLFRKGVVQLIEMSDSFRIIGEASGGAQGAELARRLQPDFVLLDLNMTGMSGIDVLQAIKAEDSDIRVIMLTVSDQTEDLVAAMRAGADGYLLKDMEPEDLLSSLEAAARGQMAMSERIVQLLARALKEEPRPKTPDDAGLTQQERRILERIATGKSNKMIARELGIAEATVKVHVKHLLKKLNLRGRVEAAVWAVEHACKD